MTSWFFPIIIINKKEFQKSPEGCKVRSSYILEVQILIPPESPNHTEPLQDMAILALDKCQWLPANVRDVAQRFVNAKLLSPVMMTWVADEPVTLSNYIATTLLGCPEAHNLCPTPIMDPPSHDSANLYDEPIGSAPQTGTTPVVGLDETSGLQAHCDIQQVQSVL